MFENLSENFKKVWSNLIGKKNISSLDLEEVIKKVKVSLLEADVSLTAINHFIQKIKENTLNKPIDQHLTAEQFLIKLIKQELINLMGASVELNLKTNKPAVFLLVGLQGSGKTTTCAKLAKYLQEKSNKQVMLASCDIYRPAAILQLEQVSSQVGASFFKTDHHDVQQIALAALDAAKRQFKDVLIIDTAGRLHVDKYMMQEASVLHKLLQPIETLFVVDGMTGQDAANTAKQFNDHLAITGVILTKMDGDSRGGAALSVRQVTGKPIKFYTTGEKLDALEVFHADRIASRILGMGDLLSLIEEIETKVDREKAQKIAKKVMSGQFNFIVLREQLLQMKNMGGISSIIDKLPGLSGISNAVKSKVNDEQVKIMLALIDSMTKKERIHPALLNMNSRKQRICKGSGKQIMDLNKLIRHFQQMEKMSKKFSSKEGMLNMMQMMKDKLPPEFFR